MAKGSNGGIGGSGIFGIFGTVIQCQSTDNTMYCNFMKLFNVLVILMVIFYLLDLFFNIRKRLFRR